MINIENVLRDHGVGVGISKQKYLDMEKLAANGAALAAISGRTSGMSAGFFDLFNGITTYSAGLMDTRKTTANQALISGTTILTDKVVDATGGDSVNGFIVGSELTIQDDVNKEYITVTAGGISTESVTYDLSTPTTVVASAYTTSKDARPQILSNGWIVSLVKAESAYGARLYISKDNGATTSQLCWIAENGNGTGNYSIVSYGTKVTVLAVGNYSASNYSYTFDATTVSNIDISSSIVKIVDSAQTSFGSGCSLAINSTGTELHATWSSKNSTYPNSFNIRYAKGTISAVDGSVNWGSVVQVTGWNTSGTVGAIEPCINIVNDFPYIYHVFDQGASYKAIVLQKYNGSSFQQIQIYNGTSYAQSSPDAITDQNGILWVVWRNIVTAQEIDISKSLDGGITWSAKVAVNIPESGMDDTVPSITSNKDGKVFVIWKGVNGGAYKLLTNSWNGTSWAGETVLLNDSSVNNPSTCSNYQDFTDPICIYYLNGSSVKFRGIFTQTTQTPHLEVTPLQNNYKTNVWCYRSLGNVDTVNGRLGFSEGFDTGGGVYAPLLSEDIRYTITPSSPVSQVVSWTDYDLDGNFSIDTKISLVNTSSPESFGTTTKKTTLVSAGINEDQNVYVAPINSRITKRLTISRANTSVTNKYVIKILGALG